jgi:hypothetical protein
MSLSHLLYVSRATRPLSHAQLEHLAVRARRSNQSMGITGLLLHGDGKFMHLLEGDRDAVQAMFERIRADERHTDVVQMICQPVHDRLFPQWHMGLLNLSGDREIDRTQLEWLLRHLRHPSNAHNRTADALALLGDFHKQPASVLA